MAKLRTKAYERFTESLLAREIMPGQFVTQRELVEITGMPLGAVRELIPRLEVDGLITTVPQRGLQVAHVDVDLIRNAFQFRHFLEREAVREYVRLASDDDIAELRRRHEVVLAAARSGPIDEDVIRDAQLTDWYLHDSIIDALGNKIISSAYRVNSIKIRLINQSGTRLFDSIVEPVMTEHLGIIAALEARDADLSERLLCEHITSARNRALGV
jgi:DNA-binding GntR family transcriptional regulator